MAIKNGTDLILSIITGTVTKVEHIIGCAKSHSLNVATEVRDVTSKETGGYKSSAKGRFNWTASVDGLVSYDTTNYGYGDLLGLMLAGTVVKIASIDYTGAVVGVPEAGAICYVGDALITSVELAAGDAENATFNLSFEGSGALTETTYSVMMA